jgi:FkbM family methyltransferase
MIINANDAYIGRSIETYGAWADDDIGTIQTILELLLDNKKQVCFYDVGANIGTHSIALAKLFGDRIRIRAFEAQRQMYYILCGNVAINGLDNITCELAAVSNVENHCMSIQVPDYNTVNNFGGLELVPAVHSDNQTMSKPNMEWISTVKLDSYHEEVDFIKLDIEGMEHLALAGASQLIKTSKPICFVEVFKTDSQAVKLFFKELNYVAYAVDPENWMFIPADSDIDLDDCPKVEL